MGRWLASLGLDTHPRRAVRAAAMLWALLALVVWNVVFDRLLVLAGRRFVHAAAVADSDRQAYLLVDPWMRQATVQAFWMASAVAIAVLVGGGAAILIASRRDNETRQRRRSVVEIASAAATD